MRNLLFTIMMAATPLLAQQTSDYKLHRYDTTDGGILWNMSDNGLWGITRLGSSQGGGNATPKLFSVATDEAFEVRYQGQLINVADVTDDGNLVVGSLQGCPVAFNRLTGELTQFPLRPLWAWGGLTSVTPDGKWAVGYYNNYLGQFGSATGDDGEEIQLTGDYYYSPLMVNIETGDTLGLPGLPKLDMAHLDQHAVTFNGISPDGRYVIGQMDWYILQPVSGFTFIYDTREHTYQVVGFEEHTDAPWQPDYPSLHHIEGGVFSPNGRYLAGSAYITREQAGSEFYNEYTCPFRYDMVTGEMRYFDDAESNNITVGAVTDEGVLFGNPETGGPLRNFRVLYKDRYWISFSQICQQALGFNFLAHSGYEYTGTVMACSNDGQRFISFPDPMGESYLFDFGRPVNEACAQVDLLRNYTVSPEAGAEFALVSNFEINFGRAVQVLGDGSKVHLYKSDGTLVYNGLSNGGLTLKTGSKTTVVAAFRTRPLEADTDYELVIEAGAIAVADDAQLSNTEIRIPYRGRKDGPVSLVKATPDNGSTLRQIDNSSSYVLLTFDSRIKLTDNAYAYIERTDDGSLLSPLSLSVGTTDETRRQLLLTPSSTVYLYAGEEYRLVVEAGSLSDCSGTANSLNERVEINYTGSYVREVTSETVMFADNFNDPNNSLNLWLQFEGDHRTPTSTMQAWGFSRDNTPWNFTLRDDEGSADFFAGSHSMYSPAGTSDDWMITQQVAVPLDGKATLQFDAQSYLGNKQDALTVYVYEDHTVLSHLNTPVMNQIRSQVVLLDSILLTPGANAELTAGEWTHYTYSLAPWAGKDIYIAFVNQNNSQSAVFVDNVLVQREVNFTLGFSNRERVVAQEQISIAGQFTVLCDETEGTATLTLCDAEGNEVSHVEWQTIPTRGVATEFAFPQPLPLALGKEVAYSIEVQIGSKHDVYNGRILNLAFEPTKRVVLEEMTGNTCVNCPLGIIAIEECQRAFGDRFIPLGIHTYTGDNLGSFFSDYTSFLGLNAAPTARINRLPAIYSPMVMQGDEFFYNNVEGETLWYDVVSAELDRLAVADLQLTSSLSQDGKQITFDTQLRYALDADNQQLSLLLVVTEDGVSSYQLNAFSNLESAALGEWGKNGAYADYAVYPYLHNHVVRGVIGQTFSGTIGVFPSQFVGGEAYTAQLSCQCPESILDNTQLTAVAILINTQTGEVVNAAQAHITAAGQQGITQVDADADASQATIHTLTGTQLHVDASQLPAGIYVIGHRKVIIR